MRGRAARALKEDAAMGRLNRDVFVALILLVVWGLFFWQTLLVRDMEYATIGSEVWPQIILVCLFLLTAGYLFQSLRQDPSEATESGGIKGWLGRYRNALWCYALFFLFLITLNYLGMLIGGVLFVFLTLSVLGEWAPRVLAKNAAIAVISITTMWAIFTFGLRVMLPAGEILRIY
jgi:putative tricarboxylic transport membrane protein